MTEDPKHGEERNEPFAGLLAMVKRLEWAGAAEDGAPTCPICGAAGPGSDHVKTCDLKLALDATTNRDRWSWCRCKDCECPNRVDPAHISTSCQDCAGDLHFSERETPDA